MLQSAPDASSEKVRQLLQLQGIGSPGSWLLVMELFAWRACKNRREVGGRAGGTQKGDLGAASPQSLGPERRMLLPLFGQGEGWGEGMAYVPRPFRSVGVPLLWGASSAHHPWAMARGTDTSVKQRIAFGESNCLDCQGALGCF